jgi:chemotaxis protein methyltransferase CheR
MDELEIEQIEIDLLLEAAFRRYGYDFRSYSRASVERRIRHFLAGSDFGRISDLIPRIMTDGDLFSELARNFSVSVTEMFRDPFVYKTLREQVMPVLRTFPFVKVWHAGCATGEEAYSLAIVMRECELLERATIYGTDFNDEVLDTARKGIYPDQKIREFTRNYQDSGGTRSFSDYYHSRYGSAALLSQLKDRITFASHNLVSDGVFGEMQLVFCRNVLIYFDRELQDRVLGLFTDSLVHGGFLCLGTKEDLRFSAVADQYEVVDAVSKIYKKVAN